METKRKNIAHICNLILMALKDNDFHIEEMRVIIRIASRMGISPTELNKTLLEGNLELHIPENKGNKIEQLNDLVMVMMSDNIVHEEELKYLSKFLSVYGFEEKPISESIKINSDFILSKSSYKSFLREFESITGDKLSQVVVDNHFNIRFPLYERVLNLAPLPKTLYIFFLLQEKPIPTNELSDAENLMLLKKIYSKITEKHYYLDETIKSLHDTIDGGFNRNRTIIKKSIKENIPNESILGYYEISGKKGQPKLINLNKELIQIIPDFRTND